MKKIASLLLTQALIIQPVSAQDDFGGEFGAPPPPPPDFGGGAPTDMGMPGAADSGAGGGSMNSAGGGNGTPGLLNKNQKNKFSKASIEDITDANFPETIESFDFPNADIQDIVKAISELTGKNFIIDNGLRGKITIIAPSRITVAEAYKAFLSALAINGYAIVPQGKFLKIRSARNAQRDSIETYSGNYYPNSDQMITRIIHLKHIQAEAVNRDLRILSSKDGEMSVYPPTNSIILSDYGSNIDRVMKIITQLDVPGFEDQMEVIPVRYAKAKDIAELIDKIVNKGQGNQQANRGGFTAGVPRFSRAQSTQGSQGSAYYMVIPDDRTNSLIVVGNKAGIARIKKLLTQLDFRIRPEDAGGVYVYYMKNGDAKKIAATLQGVAKDAAPKPSTGGSASPLISPIGGVAAPQEIFGGDVKIQADEGTNSLVIVASKQDYEVVLNLLKRIDIPRDQVYVEAIIMEMKSTDAFNYQIGYFQFDKGGSGAKVGFNGFTNANSLASLLSPQPGAGTILGFGSGDKVTITPPGQPSVTVPSLVGFVNFLKTNANANILSTPQILALDAQEALISVGDKVVTGTKVTPGANGTQSLSEPNFEEANIELKIKPFISPKTNTVRMELKSNIKQLSLAKTPEAFQTTTQPLATRKLETNIVVRNGDTAVLGGLMKEDDVENITKVPLLGDIPILGWLFKSRATSKEKTNMLIFLTPKIVRTANDANSLLGQKIDQRQKYIQSIGGRDPYGEAVDEIQKRRAASPNKPTETE
ncbi:MAG: type II secretion system secretin GspD [Pseudobdellovibrionaceae bacterium]